MNRKWKPSKAQRREFAQKMQDPSFVKEYYDNKAAREAKRRSTSKYDYRTAGGEYVPTRLQYDFCMSHPDLFTGNEIDARNIVISGYDLNEKVHHDYIHVVNEKIRSYNSNLKGLTMVTKENFAKTIAEINVNELPEVIKEALPLIKTITDDFTNWTMVDQDPELTEIVSMAMQHINNVKPSVVTPNQAQKEETTTIEVDKEEIDKVLPKGKKQRVKKDKAKMVKEKEEEIDHVESVLPEIRIIKRYVNMNGKSFRKEQILSFIDSLQKMIRTHVIRKTSRYAKEIEHIQDELIKTWKKHRSSNAEFTFSLDGSDDKVVDIYRKISKSQKQLESIGLIRRFILIQGKNGVMDKATKLLDAVTKFMAKNPTDKYAEHLKEIMTNLAKYIGGEDKEVLYFSSQALNGLAGLGILTYNHKIGIGDTVYTYSGVKGKVVKVLPESVVIDTAPGHYFSKKHVKLEPETDHLFYTVDDYPQIFSFKEIIEANTSEDHLQPFTKKEIEEIRNLRVGEIWRPDWMCGEIKRVSEKKKEELGCLPCLLAGAEDSPTQPVTEIGMNFSPAIPDSAAIPPVIIETQIEVPEPEPAPIPAEPMKAMINKEPGIINAMQMKTIQFKTAGYSDMWLKLIGDVVEPYSLMIWSKPGKGKSTLMIKFANYLASELNKQVLYAAKEEGVGATLQDKFNRLNAYHQNIDILSDVLPDHLAQYDYVFIDSINRYGLNPEDFARMKKKNPSVNFILIFQSTVDGNYRGSKDWEHDMDVSLYINENSFVKAEKSRFGGHATINMFPERYEKIYRFPSFLDAEKFKKEKAEQGEQLTMVAGDDNKVWCVDPGKAEELEKTGFKVLSE